MGTVQGFSYGSGPPVTCSCGRRFQPSAVVERRGGTHHVRTCPPCTKAEKKVKRQKEQRD